MSESYKIYASKDYVDERALPEGAQLYQQLVTNEDGTPSWVNREFYSGSLLTVTHTISGTQHTWIKVSDEIPTGGAYTLGESCWYKESNTSGYIVTGLAGCEEKYAYTSRYTIVIAREDNAAIDDEYIFPERGTYFEHIGADSYIYGFAFGANTTEIEIAWDGNTETIHALPPKYLTGSELTREDEGKVLGVVDGAISLMKIEVESLLPEVTTNDNGKVLQVVDGVYELAPNSPSASDIARGILGVEYGGTGQNSIVDTTYTTARYRASALVTNETDPTVNGVINWMYE